MRPKTALFNPGIDVFIASCSPRAFDQPMVASRLDRRFEHAYHLPALFGRHGQRLAPLEVSGDIGVIAVPMSAYRRQTRLHDLGRANRGAEDALVGRRLDRL